MPMVPRIRQVRTGDDYVLHVTFENGVTKLYDIKPRLNDERFSVIKDYLNPCRLITVDLESVGMMILI